MEVEVEGSGIGGGNSAASQGKEMTSTAPEQHRKRERIPRERVMVASVVNGGGAAAGGEGSAGDDRVRGRGFLAKRLRVNRDHACPILIRVFVHHNEDHKYDGTSSQVFSRCCIIIISLSLSLSLSLSPSALFALCPQRFIPLLLSAGFLF